MAGGRFFSRSVVRKEDRSRKRFRTLLFEPVESRRLLAVVDIPVLVDGTASYYLPEDQWGSLEGGATASSRQYSTSTGTAEERGIFEFDLSGLDASVPLQSATLVVEVSVLVYTTLPGGSDYPNVEFFAYSGDGQVFPLDYQEPAQLVGTAEATSLGVLQVALDAATLESHLGGILGLRMQNPDPNGPWLAVALKEHPDTSLVRAHLLLETGEDPSLSLSIAPQFVGEADGPAAAIGTLTRTGDLSQALVVSLASSDTSELTVPSSVSFGVGQSSLTFPVAAVDDPIHDGTQTATVTATAAIASDDPVGLDTSFGSGGTARTTLAMLVQGPYAAMAIQPDGKIIAAGETGGGGAWRVTRFHPNGTLDTSFAAGRGFVDTFPSLSGNESLPTPKKVLVQPDGKILVGGKLNTSTGWSALVRYNADGSLDNSFGRGGIADLVNVVGWVEDIALRSDGRIVLAIPFNGSAMFRIVNLTANGTYDPAGAMRTYSSLGGLAHQVEVLPDGKILLAGSNRVARINADYSVDTTFGDNGSRFVAWGGSGSSISELAIDDQGRIVVAGHEFISNQIDGSNWTAARLTPDGDLDLSFSGDGRQTIDFAAKGDLANALVIQPSGKILIGGYAAAADGSLQTALARLNDNGSLDATFDEDGRFVHDLLPTPAERIFDMALTDAGQLVALTGFGSDYRLARFDVGQDVLDLIASDVVQVWDNDNLAPGVPAQQLDLPENSASGTVIGSVVAQDPDGDPLLYDIVSGNEAGFFAINPSGELTVADGSALDFEAVQSFELVVRATDNGTPPLPGQGAVTIQLGNVNESPTLGDASFSIAENSAAGTVVGSLTLSEPDQDQAHTFTILSGNTGGAFAISGSGQITVDNPAALDFEGTNEFALVVRVADNGTPSLSDDATVTIGLSNVNEPPIVANGSFTLAENSPSGTAVGALAASDPDAGQTIDLAIVGGNTAGAFAIDASGNITLANAAAIDYETNPSFTLTVRVTDDSAELLSSDATVVVTLTNVNEAPTIGDAEFSVAENSANGVLVGTVSATDPDSGQTLVYAIVGGNTSGAFGIDGSGRITVANAQALDFETTPVFHLTVQVTDSGNPSLADTAAVTVRLADVAEAIEVNVNVDPSDPSNEINLARDRKVQLALLSSATFDARNIDLAALRVGRTGSEDSLIRKRGSIQYSLADVNGDGRLDVVVWFDPLLSGLQVGDSQVKVTAQTLDGKALFGSDSVMVISKNGGKR